jgi:RNA polymerase sigma-70 factor (ECF subfamily)
VTPDEPSDNELWERAVAGDRGCFGALFERHARRVYNHCFRLTASWADAEELTSATFLEAWRRRHDVRPRHDTALPWLLGVANNLVRNHRRSRGRYHAALARLPRVAAVPDTADDVAGRLADEAQMRGVLELFARLPERHQEVLALCAWAGLTYEQAADVLGVPVGTVRSRLARARSRLVAWDRNPPRSMDTDVVELARASRNVEEEE